MSPILLFELISDLRIEAEFILLISKLINFLYGSRHPLAQIKKISLVDIEGPDFRSSLRVV